MLVFSVKNGGYSLCSKTSDCESDKAIASIALTPTILGMLAMIFHAGD